MRAGVKTLAEALMELEVAAQLGAEPHQRTPERLGYRNGHRRRDWDTRVGSIKLAIPRTRRGSYFPAWLLEPRRRAERALVAVVQEAYVPGVSTRKVDALVRALGMEGISKSEVSRLYGELERVVKAFRERRLDEARYPYLWLDARYEKVREGGRIVSMAFLTAIAVNERGEREVLGCEVAAGESGAAWTAFLRSLVGRGLSGVRLVTSDAHTPLRELIRAQDCRSRVLSCSVCRRVRCPSPARVRCPTAGALRVRCPPREARELYPLRRRLPLT